MSNGKFHGSGSALTLLLPLAAALSLGACGQRADQDGGSATYGNEQSANPMAGETGDPDNMSGTMNPGTNGMTGGTAEPGGMGTGGLPATGAGETGTGAGGTDGGTTAAGTTGTGGTGGGTQP